MATKTRRYTGVYPVVPTIFKEDGTLDLEGQKRAVDFMIDAGSSGLSILANFSEQFLLSDEERKVLTELILNHVAGRVPVIVTTSHYSTDICAQRCMHAESLGAAMVMMMPPYHGATIRCDETAIYEFYAQLSNKLNIPIMIQDAPVSGTPLSVNFLVKMAKEIEQVSYFKIETAGAASKLYQLIQQGGDAIEGPWDGEEAITLLADLDAGATGAMTGGGYPDGIVEIFSAYRENREKGVAAYQKWLPLINYENRQSSILTSKVLMEEGGVIKSAASRHPYKPVSPFVRKGLLDAAKRLDPLVLRWAK